MSQSYMCVPGAEDANGEDCDCALREVLDRISGKWSVQIIVAVSRGPVRFTELERAIEGVSRRMLTLTLRNLERDGLISRKVYPTVPPKVEYTATPMALELFESLVVLTNWAERHRPTVAAAREAYDREHVAAEV
jgi:DNA-binding HxlR family transcriptional regulator